MSLQKQIYSGHLLNIVQNILCTNLDQKLYVKASLEMSSYFCDFYTNPVPFNPRLISSVSTPDKNEVLPVISPDNEQLYFTCEYDEHIKGDVMFNHAQVFKMSTS